MTWQTRSLELAADCGLVIAVLLQCNLYILYTQGFPVEIRALQRWISCCTNDMQRGGSPTACMVVHAQCYLLKDCYKAVYMVTGMQWNKSTRRGVFFLKCEKEGWSGGWLKQCLLLSSLFSWSHWTPFPSTLFFTAECTKAPTLVFSSHLSWPHLPINKRTHILTRRWTETLWAALSITSSPLRSALTFTRTISVCSHHLPTLSRSLNTCFSPSSIFPFVFWDLLNAPLVLSFSSSHCSTFFTLEHSA